MSTNEPEVSQQEKRILIVDDSEDMRVLLAQILEDESYALQFAENGQQALDAAKRFRPDLILLDMSLPGMTGWEVVPQLRLLPEFSHTPIIAVTAHVSKVDLERSLALGCTAHLSKPFDIATVLDMITDILEKPFENFPRS